MEKFIKACISILPKPLQNIYYKYEEKWLYLVFGVLTTLVSIITKFIVFTLVPGKPAWESTLVVVLSWITAVTFAFFTNKKYVFKSETKTKAEFWKVFVSFYGARVVTLLMEEAIFLIFYDWIGWSEFVVTLISQVIILIANYVLSKIFVFKGKKNSEKNKENA